MRRRVPTHRERSAAAFEMGRGARWQAPLGSCLQQARGRACWWCVPWSAAGTGPGGWRRRAGGCAEKKASPRCHPHRPDERESCAPLPSPLWPHSRRLAAAGSRATREAGGRRERRWAVAEGKTQPARKTAQLPAAGLGCRQLAIGKARRHRCFSPRRARRPPAGGCRRCIGGLESCLSSGAGSRARGRPWRPGGWLSSVAQTQP